MSPTWSDGIFVRPPMALAITWSTEGPFTACPPTVAGFAQVKNAPVRLL